MTWSPFRTDVMQNPANGHATLLEQCPVHRCEEFDPAFYTLSRYEDVQMALRDIETFSSEYGQGPRFNDPVGMLCDPPQHTHLRGLIQQAFAPRAMRDLRPRVETLTQTLVQEIKQGANEFDLHDDFAFPLPVIIIAGMLGVPEADLDAFKHWSDIQVAAMGAEDPSIYAEEQGAFFSYMQAHLEGRKASIAKGEPVADDLLTLIADGRDEKGELLNPADAQSMLQQLLVGGNETTTSLITNLVWRLLQHREQWQLLREDRSLVDAAIEESLRFDPPVLGLYRNTTRDVTLHGETIPAGSKVYMYYAAANRDPDAFPDPNRFDITRKRKKHLSFGLGTHFCLGAPMARMETEIALHILLDELPNLKLRGDGERIAPFFLWGRRTLPVSMQ